MDSAKEITAYLDRIELLQDDTRAAVLYVEDDDDEFRQFVLPADFLPENADEGDYFTITIRKEE